MSDPKHPLKVVIMVKGGQIVAIYQDRPDNVKFLIADYDTEAGDSPTLGVDKSGDDRYLYEHVAWCDTVTIRGIINKSGNPRP